MSKWASLSRGGPQPPQENIDKWERAVNEDNPSILTTEDRLRMLRRWPLDQANYYCNFYVECTVDEVVQKAARRIARRVSPRPRQLSFSTLLSAVVSRNIKRVSSKSKSVVLESKDKVR